MSSSTLGYESIWMLALNLLLGGFNAAPQALAGRVGTHWLARPNPGETLSFTAGS